MKQPFVLTLPNDGSGYRSLLKPPRAVNLRSGLVWLEPGRDVGLHSTEGNEEMLVILEGDGVLECEGCSRLGMAGGQIAYVPPDTRHNVFNTGTGPLRYIYIVSRVLAD